MAITYLDAYTNEPLTDYDLEQRFEAWVNEVSEDVTVLGLTYSPSAVLKNMSSIDYRVMFSEWLDAEIDDGAILEKYTAWNRI